MKFTESLGQFSVRVKSGGAHKPKKTLKELADEFGVSIYKLAGMMRRPDAPKFLFKHKNAQGVNNAWYDPQEVRKWYHSIVEK